jgi:hypothetical protein
VKLLSREEKLMTEIFYIGSLSKILGNSNYAYAGFTGSTGTFYQNTYIYSWQPLINTGG